MKGPWKVTSNLIGESKLYAVYRLIDIDEIDHSGNREYGSGYFGDRGAAQSLADRYNNHPDELPLCLKGEPA